MSYSKPVYNDGLYFFLQADYGLGKVTLYKYLPEEALEAVAEFGTDVKMKQELGREKDFKDIALIKAYMKR